MPFCSSIYIAGQAWDKMDFQSGAAEDMTTDELWVVRDRIQNFTEIFPNMNSRN